MITQEVINDHSKKWNLKPPLLPTGTIQHFFTINLYGLDNVYLGTRILPIGVVPLRAISSYVRAQMLKIAADFQWYKVMMYWITSIDVSDLAKFNGYILVDFMEAQLQIRPYHSILCALIVELHPFTIMYVKRVLYN